MATTPPVGRHRSRGRRGQQPCRNTRQGGRCDVFVERLWRSAKYQEVSQGLRRRSERPARPLENIATSTTGAVLIPALTAGRRMIPTSPDCRFPRQLDQRQACICKLRNLAQTNLPASQKRRHTWAYRNVDSTFLDHIIPAQIHFPSLPEDGREFHQYGACPALGATRHPVGLRG